MNTMDPLISIGMQIPVVAMFAWFVLKMTADHTKAQERRDDEWRDFLKDQRESHHAALSRLAEEIKTLGHEIAAAIAVMRDRAGA